MVYQAMRQFKNSAVILPAGYRLIRTLGGAGYPALGFIAQSPGRIVIAFRGTEDLDDVMKDLELVQVPYPFVKGAGQTHKGFTDLYGRAVRNTVLETTRGLSAAKTLTVTGHSLGGAIATLCALDLAANSKFRRPRIVTFGSPRVGDPAFVNAFRRYVRDSVRIYNANDWIPHFPPRSVLGFHYRHVGRPVELRFNRGSPLANHRIASYFGALCAASPEGCTNVCSGQTGFCPGQSSYFPASLNSPFPRS